MKKWGFQNIGLLTGAALGGREYIGKPKQPTILVCCLDEGEYQVRKFRESDHVVSPTFPDLNLTVQSYFSSWGCLVFLRSVRKLLRSGRGSARTRRAIAFLGSSPRALTRARP